MKKLFVIALLSLSCAEEGAPATTIHSYGGSASVIRVDDTERHVTCWMHSTSISCLPWLTTRAPDGGFEE